MQLNDLQAFVDCRMALWFPQQHFSFENYLCGNHREGLSVQNVSVKTTERI